MECHQSTTPFGRRSLSLGMLASQIAADACPNGANVHKWQIFRALCEGKAALGLSERALAVLNALLSFYPDPELNADKDLVVFPSNAQLSLRAHGMAPATLRRHLAVLVDSGIVIRRDSPNGKRYARKGQGGAIEQAFGFDLKPLVARAAEIELHAEAARTERRTLMLTREAITLLRRDITKMISMGLDEDIAYDWRSVHAAYAAIVQQIPRSAKTSEFAPILERLTALSTGIRSVLENHLNSKNPGVNESQNERHIQNSNTNHLSESEPSFRESWGPPAEPNLAGSSVPDAEDTRANDEELSTTDERGKRRQNGESSSSVPPVRVDDAARSCSGKNLGRPALVRTAAETSSDRHRTSTSSADLRGSIASRATFASGESRVEEARLKSYPLGLVLQACPDIAMYAKAEIGSWRDLMATAVMVRSMLGISPSAYEDACHVMGQENAAVVVAAILQRASMISSPGGYLRSLTDRARSGQFSLGPVLMALMRTQSPNRQSA